MRVWLILFGILTIFIFSPQVEATPYTIASYYIDPGGAYDQTDSDPHHVSGYLNADSAEIVWIGETAATADTIYGTNSASASTRIWNAPGLPSPGSIAEANSEWSDTFIFSGRSQGSTGKAYFYIDLNGSTFTDKPDTYYGGDWSTEANYSLGWDTGDTSGEIISMSFSGNNTSINSFLVGELEFIYGIPYELTSTLSVQANSTGFNDSRPYDSPYYPWGAGPWFSIETDFGNSAVLTAIKLSGDTALETGSGTDYPTQIPEPSTLLLFGMGFLAVLKVNRKSHA